MKKLYKGEKWEITWSTYSHFKINVYKIEGLKNIDLLHLEKIFFLWKAKCVVLIHSNESFYNLGRWISRKNKTKQNILLIYKDIPQWIYSQEAFSNYSDRIHSLTQSYALLEVLILILEIEDWSLSSFWLIQLCQIFWLCFTIPWVGIWVDIKYCSSDYLVLYKVNYFCFVLRQKLCAGRFNFKSI